MKHLKLIAMGIVSLFLLTGCASAEEKLEKYLLESGDESYLKYLELKENGQLDSNGYYLDSEIVAAMSDNKAENISVTLSENTFLDISYFKDADMTIPLSPDEDIMLSAGDSVYASEPVVKSDLSGVFGFSEYRIYEWKDGEKILIATNDSDRKTVFTIPSDFKGNDIIIEPVGEYIESQLKFSAKDISTNRQVSGKWTVNGEEYSASEMKIDPTETLDISFFYEEKDYYVVKTSPEVPDVEKLKGVVTFPQKTLSDKTSQYSVELRKFMDILIGGDNKGISKIQVNSKEKANTEKIPQVRHNDNIVIDIKNGYKLYCTQFEVSTPEKLDGGVSRYTLNLSETDDETINIYVSKESGEKVEKFLSHQDSFKNAKVSVSLKDNGYELKSGDFIDGGATVIVKIIPDKNYYITGNNIKDNMFEKEMKYSDYKTDIFEIKNSHEIKKFIKVTFKDTESDIAKYTFYLDKKAIGGTVDLREEQKLTVKCELKDKEGYKIAGKLPFIYTATEEIEITDALHDKTISAEDYIKVERKG